MGRHGFVQGGGELGRFRGVRTRRDVDGHSVHDPLRVDRVSEPTQPLPVDPEELVRGDRLRGGLATGDDPAQPSRRPECVRLPHAAGDRPRLRGRRGTTRSASSSPVLAAPSALAWTCEPGRDARRQAAGVLEMVRRLQGHARPAARAGQADGRPDQRDRGRRGERAADGVRPLGDGRGRLHPPRRARARLGTGGWRNAVARAHGRRASCTRDRVALRGGPGASALRTGG